MGSCPPGPPRLSFSVVLLFPALRACCRAISRGFGLRKTVEQLARAAKAAGPRRRLRIGIISVGKVVVGPVIEMRWRVVRGVFPVSDDLASDY